MTDKIDFHWIFAPKNSEGLKHFESWVDDKENVHEEELTQEEYDALDQFDTGFFP